MQCPVQHGNPEMLLDYYARELNAESIEALDLHINDCPECARFAREQNRIWTALDVWEAPPVSAHFDQKLYSLMDADDRNRSWKRALGDWLTPKVGFSLAGACATAAFAVLLLIPGQKSNPAPSAETSRFESLEPEQAERALEDLEMLKQLSSMPSSPASDGHSL